LFDTGEAIKRSTVADEVFARLLEMIRQGTLEPGQRLPPERQLAESFGVSRATLRDAVGRLQLLGYLEVRQGDGTVVRMPDGATLSLPFRNLLQSHPHLGKDLLEFRLLLEPEVAALAAERCLPAHLAQLQAAVDKQRQRVENGLSLLAEDIEFHHLLASTVGNQTLLHVLGALQSLLEDLRGAHLVAGRPELAVEHHQKIVDAIGKGDPAAAREAMIEHLLAVNQSVQAKRQAGGAAM